MKSDMEVCRDKSAPQGSIHCENEFSKLLSRPQIKYPKSKSCNTANIHVYLIWSYKKFQKSIGLFHLCLKCSLKVTFNKRKNITKRLSGVYSPVKWPRTSSLTRKWNFEEVQACIHQAFNIATCAVMEAPSTVSKNLEQVFENSKRLSYSIPCPFYKLRIKIPGSTVICCIMTFGI